MLDQFPYQRPFLRRNSLWVAALLLLALAAGLVFAFFNAGVWLVQEDTLRKAQAVVVLSGGLPYRALGAAELFHQSETTEVWLTRPMQPGAAMQELNLPFAGEEEYSRMVLISKGVPPDHIRILQPPIANTAGEMQAILIQMRSQPGQTVIVVTSKAHTRRVRVLWNRVSHGIDHGSLLVRGAPQDTFDAQHWWRTSNDALSVVREYLGLLNAWAGLPLPHGN